MSTQKHHHKFKRIKYKSGNAVYFCTLPDCTFKIAVALSLGKRSLCNRCGKDFIMNEYAIRLSRPHCESCHMPKESNKPIVNEQAFNQAHRLITLTEPTGFEVPTVDSVEIIGLGREMTLTERLENALKFAKSEATDEDI